ncbi:MAG: chitobiase/beta-hexosaminidase C-terminal domain-containing protein [Prevotella sp.]|nr:chitobiase/beta-hexosaminidase C-terminal domain-containing protein [Prevotella sp.]
MKKCIIITVLALFATLLDASAQGYRRWDFTQWSQQTIDNLKAEAAQPRPAKGWSDIEKTGDDKEGAVAPEATHDNCFWLTDDGGQWLTEPEGGSLKANGTVIAETEGLIFNPDYTKNRSLAIAVNYGSTSLGEYAGPQYLWLGGGSKNLACFTIPNVLVGQKITMTVESHKIAEGRGVELYVGSVTAENKIGDSFIPTTQESFTWEGWTLPEGVEQTDMVDIIVYNTKGCHIYNIEVGEDTGSKRSVGMLYNGDASADLALQILSGNSTLEVTPIEANASLTQEALSAYDAVVVSSTVTDGDAISALKDIHPFVPMLNLNPQLYQQWGLGEVTDAETPFATVLNPSHPLFKNIELIEDPDAEVPTFVLALSNSIPFMAVKPQGLFADDVLLAHPYQNSELVAIHAHNMSHNGYLYIPYTQETLADAASPDILVNAISLLASSKAAITPAPKPSYTLVYEKLNTVVTLKSGVPSAQIFYTLDGSEPTAQSTPYTEPFNVSSPLTVKAVAMGDGYPLGEVAEFAVDIKDQASAPQIAVNYEEGKALVTITAQPEEAEVWFNLTNSAAKSRSQQYTEPFTLTGSATVTAFVGEYDSFLQSEVTTQQVTISGEKTFNGILSKFEGASFNAIGNVLNGGYNYYTEEVIRTETIKNELGEDSIVNYYQPRDSMVVYQLADDWRVRTYGQGLYYTKATTTHNVGNASGYNPATVFDDQHSDGEITSNAMQFQIVSKKDLDGRLDPPSLSLESTRAFTGPIEVSIYFSGKNTDDIPVLDILVNTDTLNAQGWTSIGQLRSLSQVYLDGTADKSFRVWKRGAAVYEGTDPVYVKVASVANAKDVNIFTVLVKEPGVIDGITEVADRQTTTDNCYDLQGRRINGTPQKGIYIRNARKYLAK